MTHTLSLYPPQEKGASQRKPKKFPGKRAKQQAQQEAVARVSLIDSIKTTQSLLKHAYTCFNQATDPDLVEAYVYEISALQARHNFLTKQLREDSTHGR